MCSLACPSQLVCRATLLPLPHSGSIACVAFSVLLLSLNFQLSMTLNFELWPCHYKKLPFFLSSLYDFSAHFRFMLFGHFGSGLRKSGIGLLSSVSFFFTLQNTIPQKAILNCQTSQIVSLRLQQSSIKGFLCTKDLAGTGWQKTNVTVRMPTFGKGIFKPLASP